MKTIKLADSMKEAASQRNLISKEGAENVLSDLQLIMDIMNIFEDAQKKRQQNKTEPYSNLKQYNFTTYHNSSNDSKLSTAKVTAYNVNRYIKLQTGSQVFTSFKNIFCGN